VNIMNGNINKRESTALVNSLTAGVVPRIGLEHIAVGRKKEIETLLQDLENIKDGGAGFRFIVGRYGSGKSFMLQMIRNYAMDRNFVVADADLSPDRRLVGTNGQGLATYRELTQHFSTRTRPDGGAIETILQKWISNIQTMTIKETGLRPGDPALISSVENKIFEVIDEMKIMTHGFDFACVLSCYWRGQSLAQDEMKQAAIRWIRGEYRIKSEAKATLHVGEIISDDNWYDYVKLLASFVTRIGYSGLIVFIDEGVNLYKIPNKPSREKNYEKLLAMFNDTMQGKAEHLGIFFGATPQFIEDDRRGLFCYDAIRTRLMDSRYVGNGIVDYASPILRLQTLTNEEIFVLLKRLQYVHSVHYNYKPRLTEEELTSFMNLSAGKLGADELLTPREVTRDFMGLLNILNQNPDMTFHKVVGLGGYQVQAAEKNPESDEKDMFEEFEL
jgi:hypothetical protein